MDLVRDLLDKQLVDPDERQLGRVDSVVIELRDGAPPRVAAIEVGFATAVARVHPRLARGLRTLASRMGVSLAPTRIPLTAFRDVGVDIELAADSARDRRLLRIEQWLSRRIVQRIPGGRTK